MKHLFQQRPEWTRRFRREIQVSLDLAVLAGAFVLAYLLRFLDFPIPTENVDNALAQLPYVVLFQLAALYFAGAYRFIWRYIGLAEIQTFAFAAIGSALPILVFRLLPVTRGLEILQVPLSVIVMDTVLAFGGLFAVRILRRIVYERFKSRGEGAAAGQRKRPVLLLGAGQSGVMAAKEIQGRGQEIDLEIRGFVDDDHEKLGKIIQGIKVVGKTEDLPELVDALSVDHVILTIVDASREEIRRIVGVCESIPVQVRVIPGLSEILEGQVEISHIRDIEIQDLLGREQVELDEAALRDFLADKRVMVTGAGGSIGSELVRQVTRFGPRRLLLVERSEFALFNIDRSIRASRPHLDIAPILADIGDDERIRAVFADERPQVVIHAAAHKHVPMMEQNAGEAIKNNILATAALGRTAAENGAEAFVLISTDKAVKPSSVMGASKRVAELVAQNLDQVHPETRFLAVRFGNVLGSAGSVVNIFNEQIARGGPVTVTHPEMVRYFMTIPEAAQLVLQAATMGKGGEIFVLDMGEPVKIVDLARDMIRLACGRRAHEIKIEYTGVRPGEKLREELELSEEKLDKTRHPKIFIGRLRPYPGESIEKALADLEQLALQDRLDALRSYLAELLPEARLEGVPQEGGLAREESLAQEESAASKNSLAV